MSKPKVPACQVYLDGSPMMVPWSVDCHYAARGALGLRRGEAYVSGGIELIGGEWFPLDETPREPWQTNPDFWRGA